jgi:hypothetical protein
MKKTSLLRTFAALATSALLLAGCGGGGGGSSTPPPKFGFSTDFEAGIAGCTVETQKKFVRAYMDEVYLWYREIPEVDATKFSTVEDYFHALLVTTPDVNGLPKDRFSAVLPTSRAQNVLQSAAPQQASPTTLLANHSGAVPRVNVFTTAGGRVTGYIQFNDHAIGAQDDLVAAFREVKNAGVQDLVLDLRFNSGGFLYIAQSTASMITGPSNDGRIFERLQYNDKRVQETAQSALFFRRSLQFADGPAAQFPVGTPLPQLSLSRVFVLTTDATCSASESIINSLRGVDVQVIRVGTTTCGKPYGFREKDNCGLAYFPIEFQGTNAKGFGDYTTGFAPNCEVHDSNRTVPAGDPGDPLLDAAKFYVDNGACPAGTATGVQSAAQPIVTAQKPGRPAWAGRLLLPQQQP